MKKLLSAFLLTLVSWFLFGGVYWGLWQLVWAIGISVEWYLPDFGYFHWVLICGIISTLRSGKVNFPKDEKPVEGTEAWGVMSVNLLTKAWMTIVLLGLGLILL